MVVGKRVLIVSSKLIDLLQKEHIGWVKIFFFSKKILNQGQLTPPHSLPLPKDCHLRAPASRPPPLPHPHHIL